MRLLSAETPILTEFVAETPPYAILSHTWGKGEVTFSDIHDLDKASGLQGFAKIKGCCEQAVADGYEWAWIDTCCIDKSSSAELSEATNSMFKWYQRSKVCYAYLGDISDMSDRPIQDIHIAQHRVTTPIKWISKWRTPQSFTRSRGRYPQRAGCL